MKAGTLFDYIEKNSISYADNKFYAFHGTLKSENPVYKIPIFDLILNDINLVYSLHTVSISYLYSSNVFAYPMISSFHIFSLKFCKLFSPCSIPHQFHPPLFLQLFAGKTWADVGCISFRTVGKNAIHFTIRHPGNTIQSFTIPQRVRCIILLTENKHWFFLLFASVLRRQYTYSKKKIVEFIGIDNIV